MPKVKFIACIEADETAGIPPNPGFDGSSVDTDSAALDILAAIQGNDGFENAVGLSVSVEKK